MIVINQLKRLTCISSWVRKGVQYTELTMEQYVSTLLILLP